jgi:hypothetical protein
MYEWHSYSTADSTVPCPAVLAEESQRRKATTMVEQAVRDFLNALGPDLRRRAVFPFAAEERWNWHYIPTCYGVRIAPGAPR